MTTLLDRLRTEAQLARNGNHPVLANSFDLAIAEIDRLNKWADGFSDAQLKERRLCEERIQEIERSRDWWRNAVCRMMTLLSHVAGGASCSQAAGDFYREFNAALAGKADEQRRNEPQ